MRMAALLLIAASACAAQTPPELGAGRCDAARAQFAVGQVDGAALGEKARRAAGAQTVRRIRPGEIVAMIYMMDRLTLDLDQGGRIAKVRCG